MNGGFLGQGELMGALKHQFVQVIAIELELELVGYAVAHQ